MKSHHAVLIATSIVLLFIFPLGSAAMWTDCGIPVCNETDSQAYSVMCPDGEGGVIIAWMDTRNGDGDIYVQRINAAGTALWQENGKVICEASLDQNHPAIVSDGSGGAIIVWEDYRGSNYDIYAQHVDANGNVHWQLSGLAICTASNNQRYPCITTDGTGGAIMAWYDERGGARDIYTQRITSAGFTYWMPNGAAVCTAANDQEDVMIVSDDANGAIMAWVDERNGTDSKLYAQRVGPWGSMQWTTDGVPICTAADDQYPFELDADGAGGAILAWRDGRYVPSYGVYAQKINAAGVLQWPSSGVIISGEQSISAHPQVLEDGSGGAFIAWESQAEDSNGDMFVQRINASGTTLWQENGMPACVVYGTQHFSSIARDGAGGIFVAWRDERSDIDLYAQRLDGNGNQLWGSLGLAVCTAYASQILNMMIPDGTGGVYLMWTDYRDGLPDIYMQQIDPEGRSGNFPPLIYSVEDVPGDQGGSVNIAWFASLYDYLGAEITTYSIWRALSVPAAQALLDKGAALITDPGNLKQTSARSSVLRLQRVGTTEYFWEYVLDVNASRLRNYAKVVPTVFDCTAETGSETNYFQIIGHTADPDIYYFSYPDSGCSADNLAPAAPLNVEGHQSLDPAGLQLSWDSNSEPDLGCYRIYRGLTHDFTPGPGNLVYSPCDPEFFDGQWRWDSGYYYKISALDIHGNESSFTLFYPDDVTGTGNEVPLTTFLAQNYPNPFNPATSIRFGLAKRSHVTLEIFDAAGRPVRVLVNEMRDAAVYTEQWQGRDAAGRPVSSGVYFCRLATGEFERTHKMVLLK